LAQGRARRAAPRRPPSLRPPALRRPRYLLARDARARGVPSPESEPAMEALARARRLMGDRTEQVTRVGELTVDHICELVLDLPGLELPDSDGRGMAVPRVRWLSNARQADGATVKKRSEQRRALTDGGGAVGSTAIVPITDTVSVPGKGAFTPPPRGKARVRPGCSGLWPNQTEEHWTWRIERIKNLQPPRRIPTMGRGDFLWRDGEGGVFRPHDPERPVSFGAFFGGARAPGVLLEADPCEGLACYLLYDPDGPFPDSSLESLPTSHWMGWGFEKDKDGLSKADWCALPSSPAQAELFIPRLGKNGMARRAPPRVEAFAEAFRNVNSELWHIMYHSLQQMRFQREDESQEYWAADSGSVPAMFAELISEKAQFGSIEAHIRWGTDECQLPSCMDGAPSILQLGFVLDGRSTLRMSKFFRADEKKDSTSKFITLDMRSGAMLGITTDDQLVIEEIDKVGLVSKWNLSHAANQQVHVGDKMIAINSLTDPQQMEDELRSKGVLTIELQYMAQVVSKGRNEKDVWDSDLWDQDHLEDLELDIGSSYLASPFCFEHGLRYEGCAPWEGDDPSISLLFRLAFPADLGFEVNWMRSEVTRDVASLVTGVLKVASDAGYVRLPTLGEVQVAEAQQRKAAAAREARERAAAKI